MARTAAITELADMMLSGVLNKLKALSLVRFHINNFDKSISEYMFYGLELLVLQLTYLSIYF